MPFMLGSGPIRRTLNYLKAGDLIFKDRVKILELHYNRYYRRHALKHLERFFSLHQGMEDFHYWDVPQIQYANPKVQIVRFVDMMPNPYIRCWLEDGTDVIFDCFGKDRQSIRSQLAKVLGKTGERLKAEEKASKDLEEFHNPALFGFNQEQFCICEIPGQVPCPGICPLPMRMIGKFSIQKPEVLETWEKDLDAEYRSQKQIAEDHKWYPMPVEPPQPYVKDIEKPHLREYGKTSIKDIAPPDSYYEWHARKKPIVEED